MGRLTGNRQIKGAKMETEEYFMLEKITTNCETNME